jgi:hypothetical protein
VAFCGRVGVGEYGSLENLKIVLRHPSVVGGRAWLSSFLSVVDGYRWLAMLVSGNLNLAPNTVIISCNYFGAIIRASASRTQRHS